jgi:hypothetical protein
MGDVVTVLTFKSFEHIVEDRGSQSWRADRSRLKRCSYVVCVRNRTGPYRPEGPEEHRHAFLVGKVSDVVDAEDGDGRQKIEFSEYAAVTTSAPEMPLNGANPVQYHGSLEALGIDPATLEWKKVGAPETPIMQAKKMLSVAYSVPLDAIEISIRM